MRDDRDEILRDDEELHLARIAVSGEQWAFDSLVLRHRQAMVRWAESITRDRHVAEDVVQDALVRAFLHLDQLSDPGKFLGWVQRIIRNQAMMRLRRGGPFGRESPWSSLELNEPEADGMDPIHRIESRERAEQLWGLLGQLGKRERAIFEAHLFEERPAREIAEWFGVSPGHVYNSLHRSRQRLREEQTLHELSDSLRLERVAGGGRSRVLLPPGRRERLPWRECQTSAAVGILGALRQTGWSRLTLTDVMGQTSLAFRIQVEARTVDATGPTAYFWETVLPEGLLNAGAVAEYVGDGGLPPSPALLREGIDHLEAAIAGGSPVMAWDLLTPEFGLIYGYDREAQLLDCEDRRGRVRLPYARLGRGESGGLFLLSIAGYEAVHPIAALYRSLRMAVQHAHGDRGPTGYVNGYMAYEQWSKVLRSGAINLCGSAYTAWVVSDARQHAVRFLEESSRLLSGRSRDLILEAARSYAAAAQALCEFRDLFPVKTAGVPDAAGAWDRGADLLLRARFAEEEGAERLQSLTRLLRDLPHRR